MIARLIGFSARHRFWVLGVAVAVFGSLFLLPSLSLDAIPDALAPQVVVVATWHKSPDLLNAQLTAPLVRDLMKVPGVKTVRGYSDTPHAFIYVIFDESIALRSARRDVAQTLQEGRSHWPSDATLEIGPEGSGLGWVYQYALRDTTGALTLYALRDLQETLLKPRLEALPGVAEVATVGGLEKEIHVEVDPQALSAHGFSMAHVMAAVHANNKQFSPGMMTLHGQEVMLRGDGRLRDRRDLESLRLGTLEPVEQAPGAHASMQTATVRRSAPVRLQQVAQVREGAAPRRGVAELDGEGEVVGGIVIMRQGENALRVIRGVHQRIQELQPLLPAGVEILPTYDRSRLIKQALLTLGREMLWQMAVVSIVVFLFLRHFPSAIVPILTIPLAVVLVFPLLLWAGVTVNIMSLAGLMISIGVLVDGAIIEVENAYQRLAARSHGESTSDLAATRLLAIQEVGPSVFYSLLVVAVAFLPVFALTDQEGRLFGPLAISKTMTMAVAAILAVTVDPAMRMLFTRTRPFASASPLLNRLGDFFLIGRYEQEEPGSWLARAQRLYGSVCQWTLRHPRRTFGILIAFFVLSVPMAFRYNGSHAPLEEGSLLFMPVTAPGITVADAAALLQRQDAILRRYPEVSRVFGKVGRADTATDPAPVSMIETTILLKPKNEWRRGQTLEKVIQDLDRSLQWPGVQNAWTMPIKGRMDMLSTGMQAPLGLKLFGPDLRVLEDAAGRIERVLKTLPHTRHVVVERNGQEPFVDFDVTPDALAPYGLTVDDVDAALMGALGGMVSSTLIEGGMARSIRIQYPERARSSVSDVERILVRTPSGNSVPLKEIARVRMASGPAMLRNEEGSLCTYILVEVQGIDLPSYVREATRALQEQAAWPASLRWQWSGQYEHLSRTWIRLRAVIPLTFVLIGLLLYWNTRSRMQTGMILLTIPFSLIGSVWFLAASGYALSTAVAVGGIALLGLDAETGIFMLMYLNLAYREAQAQGDMTPQKAQEAVMKGAVKRLRPKLMTGAAIVCSFLPLYVSSDIGADTLKRIGAPMAGGIVTSILFELLLYPLLFYGWKMRRLGFFARPSR